MSCWDANQLAGTLSVPRRCRSWTNSAAVEKPLICPPNPFLELDVGLPTSRRQARHIEQLWEDTVWIWGLRLPGLGGEGRLDLHTEIHRVGVVPYTHGQFTSGLAQG